MAFREDYTGIRYKRLVALRHSHDRYWHVRCDCGVEKVIRFNGKSGAKSCGCLHIERCKSGINSTVHGDARLGKVTRLHNIWRRIIGKCYTKTHDHYKWYGARGIGICEEWRSNYTDFRDWAMKNGYDDKLTINRINNNGNYEPENCNWVTMKEQSRNTRHNRYVIVDNERMPISVAAEKYMISGRVIQSRLVRGWDDEKAVKTKIKGKV